MAYKDRAAKKHNEEMIVVDADAIRCHATVMVIPYTASIAH